jgi:hypothetical protein
MFTANNCGKTPTQPEERGEVGVEKCRLRLVTESSAADWDRRSSRSRRLLHLAVALGFQRLKQIHRRPGPAQRLQSASDVVGGGRA